MIENIKNGSCQNLNLRKLNILEGFKQNGYHNLFQRIVSRILTPVKDHFRHVFDYDIF